MLIIELDRLAVLRGVEVVRAIPDSAWAAPTPCSEWPLRELVAHMTAQHHGFAAAAAGSGDPRVWDVAPLGSSPRDDHAAAARAVLEAFGDDGVVDRRFSLPEILPDRTFPGAQAIGFHFVDYVVHAWDVAVSIGVAVGFEASVVDAALDIVEREVPTGPAREQPGAPFAPPVHPAPEASTLDRLLALVGRSPDWAAP